MLEWISQSIGDEKQQKRLIRKAELVRINSLVLIGKEKIFLNNCLKHKKLRIRLSGTEARISQQVLKVKCIDFILKSID